MGASHAKRAARAASQGWRWLLLVGLATLPFAGSLSHEPLWDDAHYVFDNPTLADRSRGLERIWRGEFLMDYYPVTQSLLWAEYAWFGEAVWPYRLGNLLLHAAGAAAVWQAARIWRLPWPWLVAAVWACHPTNVDAVCWISQHKATVAAVLFAATLCLAGLARDRPGWRGWGVYAAAVATHALACLAKTDAVVMPATLAALEIWRGLGAGPSPRGLLGVAALRTLPFAVVSAGATLVALKFMSDRVVTSPIDLGGPLDRLLAAGWAIAFYAHDAAWPARLAAAYPVPRLPSEQWSSWLPLAAVGGCLAAACAARRRGGVVIAIAAAAFIAMLLPVLFIVPQGYFRFSLVADRYLHLPLLVPASLMAGGLAAAASRGDRWAGFARAAAATLLAALAAGSVVHAAAYRSEPVMWAAAIRNQPRAWYPYHALGSWRLLQDGAAAAAEPLLFQAARMDGRHPVTWMNLGLARIDLGDAAAARPCFERAVQLEDRYDAARLALGDCCLRLDDVAAARAAFSRVARGGSMAGLARLELLRIAVVTGDRAAVDTLVSDVRADAGRPRQDAERGEQFERLLALGIATLTMSPPGKPPQAAGRMLAVARAAATTDSQRARAEAWAQAAGAKVAAGAAGGTAAALQSLRELSTDQPHLLRILDQETRMLERLSPGAKAGL